MAVLPEVAGSAFTLPLSSCSLLVHRLLSAANAGEANIAAEMNRPASVVRFMDITLNGWGLPQRLRFNARIRFFQTACQAFPSMRAVTHSQTPDAKKPAVGGFCFASYRITSRLFS